jgi:glycerophosphoryl diester phosphodiesterase
MSLARAPRPLVIAHRGASGYELENSLAAFRAAGPCGADAVELDVHASADGALMVHHDPRLGSRRIAELSGREAAAHRLENGEPVPMLEQALGAVDPALKVFVEVKSLDPAHDDRLLGALAGGPNPAGYAVHSFDHRIVQRLGRRRPALSRGVLLTAYLLQPLAALRDAGATMLWQERSLVDRALADLVHEAGCRLLVWTVEGEEEITRMLTIGADGIVTNHPDVARRVVDGGVR